MISGPGVGGDDGDAAQRVELRGQRRRRDLHDLEDTRHLERGVRAVVPDLAAQHAGAGDDRVVHAIQPRVDAVVRIARGDIASIDVARVRLADITELLRRLQRYRVALGHGHAGGGLGEFAVAQLAAGLGVHDLVVVRLDLRHRHVPLAGRRGFQHAARGAPTRRIGVKKWRVLREPSVFWLPYFC